MRKDTNREKEPFLSTFKDASKRMKTLEDLEPKRKILYHSENKSLAFAVKNASFFSMALMLAAKDAGLDTHPMDGFDHVELRKAFNVKLVNW